MRRKVLYAVVAAALLLNVIVFVHSRLSKPKGYLIRAASDACSCYSERPTRVVHLHITQDGSLSINTEPTDRRHIANQLYDIYSARAESVLYLSADPSVPYQDVTEVIDLIRNVGARRSVPLPTALKNGDSERLPLVQILGVKMHPRPALWNWLFWLCIALCTPLLVWVPLDLLLGRYWFPTCELRNAPSYCRPFRFAARFGVRYGLFGLAAGFPIALVSFRHLSSKQRTIILFVLLLAVGTHVYMRYLFRNMD